MMQKSDKQSLWYKIKNLDYDNNPWAIAAGTILGLSFIFGLVALLVVFYSINTVLFWVTIVLLIILGIIICFYFAFEEEYGE